MFERESEVSTKIIERAIKAIGTCTTGLIFEVQEFYNGSSNCPFVLIKE